MVPRILYVLNDLSGGASQGIYEMLRIWPYDQYKPYAIVPPGQPDVLERVRPLFVDVRTAPLPWWNVERSAGSLRRLARATGRWRAGVSERAGIEAVTRAIADWRIDMVHNGTAVTRCGAEGAHRAGVPLVWHIKETIGSTGRLKFPLDDAALVSYIVGSSATVVAMSETTAAPFRSIYSPNLEVIPDGVDLAPYRDDGSRHLRKRLNLADDHVLVGMVAGTVSRWKEHGVFVRMAGLLADRLPRAKFVIMGPRPAAGRWPYDLGWGYDQELVGLARQLVPPGRLELPGMVPDPPDIMRSLDVLVHPCRAEPFGRVAIEAMAAGIPVVGPTTGGIAETVIDGVTGRLVTPGHPEAFAEAVTGLLVDPELRARMGRAGRANVSTRFTVAAHVRRITEVYERALGLLPSSIVGDGVSC